MAVLRAQRAGSLPVEGMRGRYLRLARLAWLGLAVLSALVVVATLPVRYDALHHSAGTGLSPATYAGYEIALFGLSALTFEAVGALLVWHRSGARMALLSALALVTFPVYASPHGILLHLSPPLNWIGAGLDFLGVIALTLAIYLLPDGRFSPPWAFWLIVPWIALVAGNQFAAGSAWDYASWPAVYSFLAVVCGLGPALYVMVYRYSRISSGTQRQQTAWLMWGVVLAIAIVLATDLTMRLLPASVHGNLLVGASADTVRSGAALLVPTAIALAIVRHRLWAIDLIVHRTLVYGLLTAIVVALYVVMVGALSTLFAGRADVFVSLVATGLVALLFQPLHHRLQRSVNHLLYGERDDPQHVLSRLGSQLEETLAPDAVLPTIVETVARALKLPYVGIALAADDRPGVVAAHGVLAGTPIQVPLVYRREVVGLMLVSPRPGSDRLSAADQRLFEELSRQAAAAVQAAKLRGAKERLSEELQQAHTRLVTTREEERRRLRRDLHDGLGPALASMLLQAENARDLVREDPDQAEVVLEDLVGQANTAITDIRRVVYDLRPPALDDLGLIEAVRAAAARLTGNTLSICVKAADDQPTLPAAVEVAAYRIVQEALTNTVRHAQAQSCVVRLEIVESELGEALQVDIIDDGLGLPVGWTAGIGLQSMKARAAELCGRCDVQSPRAGGPGTHISALLPLACAGSGGHLDGT